MENQKNTPSGELNAVDLLCKFIDKKPSLNFADYGDVKIYRRESREITNDRIMFYDFLRFALSYVDNLNEKLTHELINSNRRLTLENGKLIYCTGQYFPTEYRPAGTAILKNILWNEVYKNIFNSGESDNIGAEIRKTFKRNLTRKTYKEWIER